MLVKWGSIIVKGSGKLGGHVFSSGPSGASVHTLAKARNPQTKYQSDIRSRFTRLTQGWRDLTEAQRESWYDAESTFSRVNRFGDVISLSGKNLYESLNSNRQIIGLSTLDLAPMPSVIPEFTVDSVVIFMSDERIIIDGNFVIGQTYVIVATAGLSQGVRNFKNEIRNIEIGEGSLTGNVVGVGASNYNAYVDKFGTPVDGAKIFIGVYSVSLSGQKSPVSMVQAVVA